MAKRRVKQKIREVKEIIELWIKFGSLVKDTQTGKSPAKEQEAEFLNIKTELARKQQLLSTSPLKVMNILSRATSLDDIAKMPEMQARQFYNEWHETYLNLNELLGKVESGEMTLERPMPISREKQERRGCRGCLYHIILLVVFIILLYICFRVYEKRFDMRTRIQGTIFEKVLQKFEKIMPEKGDKEPEKGDKL